MPINMSIEYPKLVSENQSLRIENQKLREALEILIEGIGHAPVSKKSVYLGKMKTFISIAKEAVR